MTASEDDRLRRILMSTRSIAMVGASGNPRRPSHGVLRFLLASGYAVTAVSPALEPGALGPVPLAARLADLPGPVDMIDVFRNSAAIAGLVDEIMALPWRPKTLWMQLGVVDEAAAARAGAAGIAVVVDRCPAIEHPRLLGGA